MKKLFCLFLIIIMCAGCAVPAAPTVPTGTAPTPPNETVAPRPDTEEEALYEALFDLHSRVELKIHMSDYELHKMQQDYDTYRNKGSKSPIYRMADLEITVTSAGKSQTYRLEQVGVRMKGNTSRTDFYNPEEGIHSLVHLKLSFQETFDDTVYYGSEAMVWKDEAARKARKDRTFATLEKLDIKWNRCDDSTFIKEHYAYEMYRANGVLAPRTNIASIDWGGVHCGIYTIYEPIDKLFLERNLPESQLGGDLYKCGWTWEGASFTNTDSIGIEDEDNSKFFVYDLKTNKKTSQHEALIRLIQTLNAGVTKEEYAQLIEVDSFLRYAAVSYLLGNPDDLRNNYNNFYLYFRPDGKAMFIPYDYDRCLGVTKQYNPNGNGMTLDDPFATTMGATGQKQENPIFCYSVCSGGYYVNEYAEILRSISASDWMKLPHFAAMFDTAKANYYYLATPGKQFRNTHGYDFRFDLEKTSDHGSQGNISFAEYVSAKLATLNTALQNVDKHATVKPSVAADFYIRAEFTNWEVRDGYEMVKDEQTGIYSFDVSGNRTLRLKVFSKKQNHWFGAESLVEDALIPWQTDDHRNIILPAGNYTIQFDPETQQITILEK